MVINKINTINVIKKNNIVNILTETNITNYINKIIENKITKEILLGDVIKKVRYRKSKNIIDIDDKYSNNLRIAIKITF